RATALACVVEGAIHQVGYGEVEISIFAHQGGIFSAEFQTHIKQLGRGLAIDLAASLNGTGERDEIDRAARNQALDRRVSDVDGSDQIIGQTCLAESVDESIAA